METAQINDPWWRELPLSSDESDTDLCGTCGIARWIHPKPDYPSTDNLGCPGHDFRVAGFVGTYDRIPDGEWSEQDWRDPDGKGVWWIPSKSQVRVPDVNIPESEGDDGE